MARPSISISRRLSSILALAMLALFLSQFFRQTSVNAAGTSASVCIHAKTKTVKSPVIVKKKKKCGAGEKLVTWNESNVPLAVCVKNKTGVLVVATSSCTKGFTLTSSLVASSKISACSHTKTRSITRLKVSKCPRYTKKLTLPVRRALDPSTANVITATTTPSTTPLTNAGTTSTTTIAATTTIASTTTIAPNFSLTAAHTTIEAGASTILTPEFSTGAGSINQSIGVVTSQQSISVSPASTTTYVLTINFGTHTQSTSVTVYVHQVTINQNPIDTTDATGFGALLSVDVSSTGALSFQWFKNNVEISTAISNGYRATVAGQYRVRIRSVLNGHTMIVDSLAAAVALNQLTITSQPTNSTIGDGDTATMSVGANATGTLSYQWFRDSSAISGAVQSSFSTTTGGSYYVEATSSLNGTTVVERTNGIFVDKNVVAITQQPINRYFTTGQNVTVGVGLSVPGNTTMSYQWFLDNQEVAGATSQTHSASIAGTYKVKITSVRNGTTAVRFSDTASVTEVGAPTITSLSFADVSIAVNGSTTLTAVFSNGTAVLTPGNITLTSGVGVTVSPSSTEEYTVTVTNQAGNSAYETRELVVTTGEITSTANNTTGNRTNGVTAINLMNSRKVLIFGSGYNYNTTAELFDPDTNSFSTTGSMNQGRGSAPAVVLSDGRILIAGGLYYTNKYISLTSTEIYDPITGTFSTTGSLNTARRDFSMFLLSNGNVLAIGGYNPTNYELKTTEIYNPSTGLWTYGPSMTYQRQWPIAVVLNNGQILVAGGYNSANGYLQRAEIYDPGTNTFTLLADQMNIGRYEAAAIATPTGAIIIGGTKYGVAQAPIEIFRTDSLSFDNIVPSLAYPTFGVNLHQRMDGMLVYFGGSTGTYVLTDGYLIDPETFAIVPENVDLSRYRYYYASVTLVDGRVLYIGGNSTATTSAEIYSY